MSKAKRKAIFWDRDGIINEIVMRDGDYYSPRSVSDFKLIEGMDIILEQARRLEFLNIIITNQPDIARGLMERKELDKMNKLITLHLAVDDIFVCDHDDLHNCLCRKPKPGMLLDAAKRWNIDLESSFVVGDSWKDVEAGNRAGCKTVFVKAYYSKNRDGVDPKSDFIVASSNEILTIIKSK